MPPWGQCTLEALKTTLFPLVEQKVAISELNEVLYVYVYIWKKPAKLGVECLSLFL